MATESTKNTVILFSDTLELSPSILCAMNKIKGNVSVRTTNGKQVAYLALKDEKSQAKFDALLADLEKNASATLTIGLLYRLVVGCVKTQFWATNYTRVRNTVGSSYAPRTTESYLLFHVQIWICSV